MFSIGVYVTSRYKNYPEFKEYMDGAIRKYIPFGKPDALVSGDYKSTNAGNGLVARYAFENNISFRRFSTLWHKHNPSSPKKQNNAGVASNAKIIENSNGCIMFWTPTAIAKWNFMSGGCYSFQKLCSKSNLNRLLIPIKVDIYKSFSEKKPFEDESPVDNTAELSNVSLPPRVGGVSDMPSATPRTPSHGSGLSLPSGGLGGGLGGGVTSTTPTTQTVDAPSSPQSSGVDNIGDIDGGQSAYSTASNIISQIPVDTNNDGITDTNISAIDTNNDGAIDSKLVPVDADGNGTIDKVDIEPIPNTQQNVQPSDSTPAAQPSQQPPQIDSSDVVGNIDDDEQNVKS